MLERCLTYTLNTIEAKIYDFIKHSLKKNNKVLRKRLNMDNLEQSVISEMGSIENYQRGGGYIEFCRVIELLVYEELITPIKSSGGNGKKPRLSLWYWIMFKPVQDSWSGSQIAFISDVLDLSYYIKNKSKQTDIEWDKITTIHSFLKKRDNFQVVVREQRSLMLCINKSWTNGIEPEKWLASSEGRQLMKRLNISGKELKFSITKEPFTYWRNQIVTDLNKKEVLIVENLSAFHTIKQILENHKKWEFGPVPYILIWGAGNRIEGTIDFLSDVVRNPTQLFIRYAGDIDYGGLSIFVRLREKNPDLSIHLSVPLYDFLAEHGQPYRHCIEKEQLKNDSHLFEIKKELNEHSNLYEQIEDLWISTERIPQEVMNLDLLRKEGKI